MAKPQEHDPHNDDQRGMLDTKHATASQTIIIGIGTVGCRLADQIRESNQKHSYLYIDTDQQALSKYDANEILLIGVEETEGRGTGKRPDIGSRSAEEAEEVIKAKTEGCKLAVLIASFGGGTGAGASPVIARVLRENGTSPVVVAVDPFTFESSMKVQQAYEALRRAGDMSDAMVRVPCTVPVIPSSADIRFGEIFSKWQDYATEAITSLVQMLADPAGRKLDFGDLRRVLSEPGGAIIGLGRAKGEKRVETAIRNACKASLLNLYRVRSAANVLLHVAGGKDLCLSEVEHGLQAVSGLADDGDYLYGVSVDAELGDEVVTTLLLSGLTLGMQDDSPPSTELESSLARQSFIYEGVNIDTPTFQRRPRNRYTRSTRFPSHYPFGQ